MLLRLQKSIERLYEIFGKYHGNPKMNGSTVYEAMVHKHYQMPERADAQGSPPITVAKTILKASTTSNPKTRYTTGKGAKVILFIHKLIPDKWFDNLLLSQMK